MFDGGGVVDPSSNPTPFPDSVFANVIDEEAGTGTPDEEGNGLYKVPHDDLTSNEDEGGILASDLEGWKQTELRYAGPNPNNYVTFNEELWRIIGLVNVKTTSGVQQRIKIIRAEQLEGYYSWDHKSSGTGSSTALYGSNDWTDSQLMEMLNGIYYNSQNGECWTGSSSGSTSSQSTCDFTQTSTGVKGLNKTARDMIDENIVWNIGEWDSTSVKTAAMYGYERGTKVLSGRPTEWNSSNTKEPATSKGESKLNAKLFHSIGLMYPSDYGYAVGGKSRSCIENKQLYNINGDDYSRCLANNWLTIFPGEWLLTSYFSLSSPWEVLHLSLGRVSRVSAHDSEHVRPVVYLTSSVKLTGTDDISNPMGSELNPFTLIMEE